MEEDPLGKLATSEIDATPDLQNLRTRVDDLYRHSFSEKDYPVTLEEVSRIVSKLRKTGIDEVTSEHLCGASLRAWLCQIFISHQNHP